MDCFLGDLFTVNMASPSLLPLIGLAFRLGFTVRNRRIGLSLRHWGIGQHCPSLPDPLAGDRQPEPPPSCGSHCAYATVSKSLAFTPSGSAIHR